MYTIVLAIYYPIHRIGIMSFVRSGFDDVKVIEVDNGKDLMKLLAEDLVDMVILDPALPCIAIQKLIKKRRGASAMPPVLIYSEGDELTFATTFIRMGAAGYIEQKCREDQMIHAIRIILQGSKYISNRVWESYLNGLVGSA